MSVTADFYPNKAGARATYYIQLGKAGMESYHSIMDDGTITSRIVGAGLWKNGEYTSVKSLRGDLNIKKYRIKNGFVEIGSTDEDGNHSWDRELKIGAKAGDTWSQEETKIFEDGKQLVVGDKYNVVSFQAYSLEYDGSKRDSVLIEHLLSFDGEPAMRTRKTYVRNVGLVKSVAFHITKDGTVNQTGGVALDVPDSSLSGLTDGERLWFE